MRSFHAQTSIFIVSIWQHSFGPQKEILILPAAAMCVCIGVYLSLKILHNTGIIYHVLKKWI